ncbi:hypothetical protein EZ428_22955 [Pedobacter frigiditerrae]|uniref:Uncharacterized protein n=1 Tax=Pedobacter frigiditerrae TaxID=2530452 RepID=A0A4R0MKC8_9SPHI|nr:hypothetical protein [Pedobacter frigiditerrae]TCC87060.1 hypothetical protein EZ428_22955 [Pedobacter frigiditerrae]
MMNQEDFFKKLGLILDELNEQYQFLAQNPQQLSELELELFQANANFLADHIQIIKKINANQQAPLVLAPADKDVSEVENKVSLTNDDTQEACMIEDITFADQKEDEPAVVLEKQEPLIHFEEIEQEVFKLDNEPSTFEFILNDHSEHEPIEGLPQIDYNTDEKFEFEEKSVDELFNRPLSEEEERIIEQKRKLREQPIQEVVGQEEDEIGPEPFLVTKTLAIEEEEFPIEKEDLELEVSPVENIIVNKVEPVEDPSYKPTLNDLLAKSRGENINATTNVAVKDLKQAISLNDKLLYIKDLFNGYNLAYAEAIDLANKLPNFEAADNFFQKNYAAKNNWAEKQATVDKFYGLLNQRFK